MLSASSFYAEVEPYTLCLLPGYSGKLAFVHHVMSNASSCDQDAKRQCDAGERLIIEGGRSTKYIL